eukprot:TRINITY_DN3933_c1_g1_i2.p1 TRINITY_DN3933_c1_g1~~TRINITY_DN3933_c1_g1_i2.p1  ORF type:complete len:503 (+),score=134.41 TRINITY_DN3933_c1_g1_i2:58-1566(+)
MGTQISSEVFKPSEQSSYDSSFRHLRWLEDSNEKRVPIAFYEWKGFGGEPALFTLLYSHGNIEDMGEIVSWMETLRDVLHVNVVTYDYSGYGLNREQKPSEKHCYEEINIVFNYLVSVKKIPSDRIILMGRSVGTGPTIHLAANFAWAIAGRKVQSLTRGLGRKVKKAQATVGDFNGLAGVILQSPMTSVLDLRQDLGSALVPDMFENSKKISKIRCPIFIVHGTNDEIIPVRHSQRLSKTLSERHLYKLSEISGGDHFNLESEFSDEFLDQLLDFVKFITPSSLEDRASEIPVPKGIAESPANVVSNFLTAIGMEKYRDQFLSAGYYDKYAISVIGESDLDAIGVTDESHRQVILKACKEVDTLTPQLPSNGILPSPQQSMLRSRSSHHVTSPISPTYSLHSNMDSTALRKSPSNDSLPSHLRSMSETPPFEIRSFGVGEDRIVRLESQVAIQQETIDDLTYRVTAASEIIREQSQQISALYDDLNEMKNLLRALRTEKLN